MKLQCCSAKDSFHVGSVGRTPGTLQDSFASASVLVSLADVACFVPGAQADSTRPTLPAHSFGAGPGLVSLEIVWRHSCTAG